MKVLFVVTENFNDYDQHGGVPVGVFSSREKAETACGVVGRVDFAYSWYEIEKFYLDTKSLKTLQD